MTGVQTCALPISSQNTATAVCARSPFLFTVICAVASRFHTDPTLHVKCYDEAHECFVDCVANDERSVESVQACMILTVWTNAPKKAENRPQRAWLYFGMVRSVPLLPSRHAEDFSCRRFAWASN